MGDIPYLIIAVVVIGSGSSLLIFFGSRFLSGSVTRSLEGQVEKLHARTLAYDAAVDSAFGRVEPMVAYADVLACQKEIAEYEAKLEQERASLGSLEANLQKAQDEVDIREKKHNDLKMGKENSDKLADELKANRERLLEESKELQSKLEDSQGQLDSLMQNPSMTKNQQIGLEEIKKGLSNSKAHLQELVQVYEQASQRFLNLETQYSQLESEFRNLVEKQLSGEM